MNEICFVLDLFRETLTGWGACFFAEVNFFRKALALCFFVAVVSMTDQHFVKVEL